MFAADVSHVGRMSEHPEHGAAREMSARLGPWRVGPHMQANPSDEPNADTYVAMEELFQGVLSVLKSNSPKDYGEHKKIPSRYHGGEKNPM